jgi:hypothetical protein
MIIKSAALVFFILCFNLFILLWPVSGTIEQNNTENISLDVRMNEQSSLFDVRIVSQDMLNNIIKNNKNTVTILKIKKGLNIGAVKDGVIYLRGDLTEKEFPFNEASDDNTKDKISKHLTDITFGLDNPKINLFQSSQKYLIWFDAMYTDKDLADIKSFIKQINDLSETASFEDEQIGLPTYLPNYNPIPYLYYKIGFIDKDFFSDKLDDRKTDTEQLLKNKKGETVGIVSKDRLWLLSDLKNEERRYFLFRGLLFSMGFHGNSEDKDSFFYESNFNDTNFSKIDEDAIKLVYGGRIKNDMNLESVRKALGFGSDD